MNGFAPLLLLWMITRQQRQASALGPPAWPTAASPPPPIPAFLPQPATASQHGTPLSTLHNAPPKPTPPAQSKASPTHAAAKSAAPKRSPPKSRVLTRAIKARVPRPKIINTNFVPIP